jgi:hypothetical protein
VEERALVAGKHGQRGVIASISTKTKSRGQQKAMVTISGLCQKIWLSAHSLNKQTNVWVFFPNNSNPTYN